MRPDPGRGKLYVPNPPNAPPVEGRVSIGNPSIDAMLDGGLVPHRPYLIVGPSGTGKTKLVLQFLCEGVRRGERVLLVTVEEPPNEVRLNHRALAPVLDRVEVFDAIPDVMRYERTPFKDIASVRQIVPFSEVAPEIRRSPELSSVEVTITALEQMLRSEVIRRGYSRIAIDSLTALQYFCMKGFDPVGGAQTFLRFLSDLRTTTLLTVESPLENVETTERTLARGEIRLFRWELDGVTVRAIGVEKLRGSAHDIRLHPYRIGPHGIDPNLAVTISRDTRLIVEAPRPVSTVERPAPPAGPPTLAPLSDEVRDLIELGVDVRPVRGTVVAALAAVRGGRSEETAQAISRLASLVGSLAANVAGSVATPSGPASPAADAHRRLAQRADSARVGLPPTLLPSPDVLEEQLGQVLSILPPPEPEIAAGGGPISSPPPVPSAKPPAARTEVPAATVAAPAPAKGTPIPPAVLPSPPAVGSQPKLPAPPRSERAPPPPPSSVSTPGPVRPPAVAGPPPPRSAAARPAVQPPVRPMPEPPPLPASLPRLPVEPEPAPSPERSGRATAGQASPAATGARPAPPTPPPLPVVAPIPTGLPTPPPSVPPVPSGPPVPAAKRRRKVAAPRKKSTPGPSEPSTDPLGTSTEELGAGGKPKRRAIRRRKAPPVVAATPEPLPSEAPSAPPTSNAPPGGE